MLVLTRKQNEKIQIGNNITITVLRMKGKAVRLGIQAPPEYGVVRGELVIDLEDDEAETCESNPADSPRPRRIDSRRTQETKDAHKGGASWASAAKGNPAEPGSPNSLLGENCIVTGQSWKE